MQVCLQQLPVSLTTARVPGSAAAARTPHSPPCNHHPANQPSGRRPRLVLRTSTSSPVVAACPPRPRPRCRAYSRPHFSIPPSCLVLCLCVIIRRFPTRCVARLGWLVVGSAPAVLFRLSPPRVCPASPRPRVGAVGHGRDDADDVCGMVRCAASPGFLAFLQPTSWTHSFSRRISNALSILILTFCTL